jgi:hypothetical protein
MIERKALQYVSGQKKRWKMHGLTSFSNFIHFDMVLLRQMPNTAFLLQGEIL